MSTKDPASVSDASVLRKLDNYVRDMRDFARGKVDCTRCDGTGDEPGERDTDCRDCDGAGIREPHPNETS